MVKLVKPAPLATVGTNVRHERRPKGEAFRTSARWRGYASLGENPSANLLYHILLNTIEPMKRARFTGVTAAAATRERQQFLPWGVFELVNYLRGERERAVLTRILLMMNDQRRDANLS